ncbi:hypothetical protein LCGC14_2128470 [marine sediment metagenome]|uniref:Uncharacterized protein n=1 Tax=marine sediment metagenome TaxID=412755 RepID=A0A0F9GF67_9ZZZZ
MSTGTPEPEAAALRNFLRTIQVHANNAISSTEHRELNAYSAIDEIHSVCVRALSRDQTNGDVIDALKRENGELESKVIDLAVVRHELNLATVARVDAEHHRDLAISQLEVFRGFSSSAPFEKLSSLGCALHTVRTSGAEGRPLIALILRQVDKIVDRIKADHGADEVERRGAIEIEMIAETRAAIEEGT